MRDFSIVNISPSSNPTVPSTFEISFDQRASFHGAEWIDGTGTRFPFYTYDTDPGSPTPAPPTGTGTLLATTFEVVDNPKYNGRYTVYTKTSAGDLESAILTGGGDTLIRVNEVMAAGSGSELTSGRITSISTYVLTVFGESPILLLEQQNIQNRPVELMGHRTSGWGEVMMQNFLKNTQNYAGTGAPTNPFIGQLWFDTVNNLLMIRRAGTWEVVNSGHYGPPPYRFTQAVQSTTWTITHNLNRPAPFICSADFFVDTGGGAYKPILPSDVTYLNANQITATFSVPHAGYATIRA